MKVVRPLARDYFRFAHAHNCVTEAAISHLSDTLKDAAAKSVPEKCYKKPRKWKDATLSALCAQSRAARQNWKENGCPKEGPLYDEKGRLGREVKRGQDIVLPKLKTDVSFSETRCLPPHTHVVSNYQVVARKPAPDSKLMIL